MTRWCRTILGALLSVGAISANAVNCPTTGALCDATLSPGGNVTAGVQARTAGQTLCLNTGTYTPATTPEYSDPNSFAIGRSVTVCGLGATPSQTILQGGGVSDYAVKFFPYGVITSPNNATLTNVQVNNSATGGSNGGVMVYDFATPSRLSGITLRDLVVQTKAGGAAFGVLLQNTDKVNVSNVTIASTQTGFYLQNSTQALIANSAVTSTSAAGANALSVIGGTGHVIVGNTFGTPKVGATYSFNAGGVTFYNSPANRFEGNTIQGFHDDGLDYTAQDGTPVTTAQSNDNYAGKNNVIATGFADGLNSGSTIWSNCGSNNVWLYGNDAHGSPECGICVWLVKNNMVLANNLHDNGIAGLVVSGGSETLPFCGAAGGAYRFKPTSTFIHGNWGYFNKNDQFNVRNSDTTTLSANVLSPRNGFGGVLRSDCINAFCQSAFAFDINGGTPNTNVGARIVANTNHENIRGFQSDDAATTGIEFAYNRMIQTSSLAFSRYNLPGSLSGGTNFDAGAMTGGNFWTLFNSPNGNPGTAPYGVSGSGNSHQGIYDSLSNTTGRIVDRYAYQSEDFGKGYGVTVSEPRSSLSFAQGTKRTVRWYAPGCVYVDVALDGATSLASNVANTGYAVVTIPGGASIASHTMGVTCKDSSGTARGSGASPSFSVTSSALTLLAPGRDDVFNSSTEIIVAWTKSAAVASVSVDLSTDGGSTFPTTFGPFTGTVARVTLPAVASTANAVVRVRSGTNMDYTDGFFAIRGSSGAAFTNVPGGRQFVMGQLERLEWASPQNSRLVDLTATVGGSLKTIALNLPDRGNFDWIVPEWATSGTATLQANFKTTTGSSISGTSNASGTAVFPLTTPPPNPPRLANISTRGQVQTGFNVMIGGFVISGSSPKTVVVRAIGPSLANFGVAGSLSDPTLQLVRSSDQSVIATNDDWGSTPNLQQLLASGFAPSHGKESALYITLAPGAYTAIVSGVGGVTGVGLVEVYEVDHFEVPLINISTRGQVSTGFDVMIGGFVVQGSGPQNVIIRAIGPSLANFGVSGALANPTMSLVRMSDNATIATNDDWGSAANAGQISSSGFAPSNALESAILISLQPGAYTAVVSGVNNGSGVGLVEVYTLP